MVGIDVPGVQWRGVAAKLEQRARDIAGSGAAWPTRLRLFCIHCTSLVRYRAQLVLPDALLRKSYRVALQRTVSAPWMAFAPDTLHNADLLMLPASAPRLEDVSHAARWTLASKSTALQVAWRAYDEMSVDGAAPLAALANHVAKIGWHAHSSIVVQFRMESNARLAVIADAGISDDINHARIMRYFGSDVEARRMAVMALIRRRCSRRGPDAVSLTLAVFPYASTRSPLDLFAPFLGTVMYAWCTSRRFAVDSLPCALCGMPGGDAHPKAMTC